MASTQTTSFGPYTIERQLGRGSMAEVHLATDADGRQVALKVLRAAGGRGAAGERARARFLREAEVIQRLQHPNIVRLLDAGEVEGQQYLTMEYVSGITLKDVMAFEGRLSEERAHQLFSQLCAALDYAHSLGVIHRDVKPQNILIAPGDVVKLADFGLARLWGDTTLTRTGSFLGSPSYMAPEQVRGEHVDHRADLWSAGVVLYEMVSGEKPFQGRSIVEVSKAVMTEQPKLVPWVSLKTNATIREALAKSPDERPAGVAELAGARASATRLEPPRSAESGTGEPKADGSSAPAPQAPARPIADYYLSDDTAVDESVSVRDSSADDAWRSVAAVAVVLVGVLVGVVWWQVQLTEHPGAAGRSSSLPPAGASSRAPKDQSERRSGPEVATCQQNLRLLYQGLQMYCQRNDRRVPPADRWEAALRPYLRGRVLTFHPMSLPTGQMPPSRNYGHFYVAERRYPTPTLTQLQQEHAVYLRCCVGWRQHRHWSDDLRRSPSGGTHDGRSCCLYADGRVEMWPASR